MAISPDINLHRILYVIEGECATNISYNQFDYIGTDDATTCHIILGKSNQTNRLLVAHLTCPDQCQDINEIIDDLGDMVDLYIFGGLNDELSKEIMNELLNALKLCRVNYCIKQLQVNQDNIIYKNGLYYPISYGYGFHRTSQSTDWLVSPMHFPITCRGPNFLLRNASNYQVNPSTSLNIIYNGKLDLYFHIKYFELRNSFNYRNRLLLDDKQYLNMFSTSPQLEPDYFVSNSKRCLQFILDGNVQKCFNNNGMKLSELKYQLDSSNEWVLSD